MTSLSNIERIGAGARMSQAVISNGFVFLSGQVAQDAGAGVAEQTSQVLERIDALLTEAGTTRDRVVSAMIWITDPAYFAEMNGVWDGWVSKGTAPARATVASALPAGSDYKVEIMVTASAQ